MGIPPAPSSGSDRPQAAVLCDLKSEAIGACIRPAGGNGWRLHRGEERRSAHARVGKVLFPDQQIPSRREEARITDNAAGVPGVAMSNETQAARVLVIARPPIRPNHPVTAA